MATSHILGLPLGVWAAGFVAVATVPVWFGAQAVGAERATMPRSALALVLALIACYACVLVIGSPAVIVAPFVCMVLFKYILDSSFLGAFLLVVISATGLWLAGKILNSFFCLLGLSLLTASC